MALAGGPEDGEDGMARFVTDALAAAEDEPAPPRLRGRVLDAALARRPPGRPARVAPLSPVESYRRTIDEIDELLGGLDAAGWASRVEPYGWSVQGLVGHLLAVDRLLASRLGLAGEGEATGEIVDADHIGMSLDVVAAQEGRAPAETLADWRTGARRVLAALADDPPEMDGRVPFHGIEYRWSSLLVARSLEVWTHADDVRRAVGLPLGVPDAERLTLMTELAVRTLPLRLALAGTFTGLARIVLTGPGGGAWWQPLGLAEASPGPGDSAEVPPDRLGTPEPAVRLVADAVGFCRLSAGRLSAGELGATVSGDPALAGALLSTAAAFAV